MNIQFTLKKDKNLSIFYNQYYVCRCTGSMRNQGISRHGGDLFFMEYIVANMVKVKA